MIIINDIEFSILAEIKIRYLILIFISKTVYFTKLKKRIDKTNLCNQNP